MREIGYRSAGMDTTMGLGRSVSIMLPPDVWEALDAVAKRENSNKSRLIRAMIENYLSSKGE